MPPYRLVVETMLSPALGQMFRIDSVSAACPDASASAPDATFEQRDALLEHIAWSGS